MCIYQYTDKYLSVFISISISSVAQSRPTLCDPMNRSTPGLPVHHQLPEYTQTHVHWVGDATQPSHPPLSPSLLASNLSQSFPISQLFASGGQSISASASTSVLPMNTQDWSPLGWTGYTQFNMKINYTLFMTTYMVESESHSVLWFSRPEYWSD